MDETQREIELAKLNCEIGTLVAEVQRHYDAHVAATKKLDIARAKHKRIKLWQRADELRKELQEVEDEAANIRANIPSEITL
jgi:cysteinyl-tRNA synthetase